MLAKTLILFLLSSNISAVLAGLAMTSTGCADPAGFDKCWAAASNEAASLFKAHCTTGACTDSSNCYSPDAYCAEAVMCVAYTAWINCALSTCWNRVYGCEFQNLAINAIQACPLANHFPPYVPAPHDAPGYCSCNMGFVYEAHLNENRDGAGELYACENNGKTKVLNGCVCCAASSATSTFYNSCPSTDPSQVPIFPLLGYNTLMTSTCSTVLGKVGDCSAAPYGFTISPGPTYAGAPANKFFNAATIPKNGTQPLSNNPGGPSTPVSGAVITWSLYNGGATVASASVTTWNPSSSVKATSTSKTSSSKKTITSASTKKISTSSTLKTSSTKKTTTTSSSKKPTSTAKTTTTSKKS